MSWVSIIPNTALLVSAVIITLALIRILVSLVFLELRQTDEMICSRCGWPMHVPAYKPKPKQCCHCGAWLV